MEATAGIRQVEAEVRKAWRRIRRHVRQTPLEASPELGNSGAGQVLLKLENLQHTGSFKYRGATNKLLALGRRGRERGIVAASSGNHALAVGRGSATLGTQCTLFLPENASPAKVAALERLGAKLVFVGQDSLEAEVAARQWAAQRGMVYLSPYNDLQVIAGQGTLGVELLNQAERLDAVFATVGGGGLIAGLGAYLKAVEPRVRIVGCLPESSPVMYESVRAGRILALDEVETRPTLSDGSAGGIEKDSITFDLCRQCVDELLLATEDEIARAMVSLIEEHRLIVEGAAGVAMATYLKHKERFQDQRVAIVLCGGNVSVEVLRDLLCPSRRSPGSPGSGPDSKIRPSTPVILR